MTEVKDRKETLVTVLLSAEQCSDSDGEGWIRLASPEEIATVVQQHPGRDFGALATDSTSRPYYWRTILGTKCPPSVLGKAAVSVRVFRW